MNHSLNLGYWSPKIPILNYYENKFDLESAIHFSSEYWWINLFICIAYSLILKNGMDYMKDRPPFNLRIPLAIWSFSLAIFSLIGCLNCIPESIYVQNISTNHFFCDLSSLKSNPQVHKWLFFFTFSKIIELGDTFFIVLRKQKLSFLHYIHHMLTLIFSFYSFGRNESFMRMGATMNFFVHTIMYSYYSLKALKIKIPKFISIIITILQITQMIIGFFGTIYCFNHASNDDCHVTKGGAAFGISIYSLFLLLFVNFFVKSYLFSNRTIDNKKNN